MVGLLCLGSGALRDVAVGPGVGKGSDEQSLLRDILDTLQAGDILLGDAFYATYFLLAELIGGGADGVFEQFGARRRSTDFTKGEALGVRVILYEVRGNKNAPVHFPVPWAQDSTMSFLVSPEAFRDAISSAGFVSLAGLTRPFSHKRPSRK